MVATELTDEVDVRTSPRDTTAATDGQAGGRDGPSGDLLVEEVRPHVRLITINRPERLNALTSSALGELYDLFDALRYDLDCQVVIITGAGRGFCAGHDTKDHDLPPFLPQDAGRTQSNMLHQKWWATMVPRMRAMPQAIIAAVNGPVAGGGYPLALGADIRFAGKSATFTDAFVKIGLSGCEMGLSYLLPRTVGVTRAAELLLTGRKIDADEAARIGLVVDTVPDGKLLDTAIECAERITANTPFGTWMTKATFWSNVETSSLEAAIDLEARTQILGLATEDQREQMAAAAEGRPPQYRNH